MTGIVFIGDEVTAAGFRLTGIATHAPEPERLAPLVAAQQDACDLLLITTETLSALPAKMRSDMGAWARPLVVFLPDVRNRVPAIDLESKVRRELGIET